MTQDLCRSADRHPMWALAISMLLLTACAAPVERRAILPDSPTASGPAVILPDAWSRSATVRADDSASRSGAASPQAWWLRYDDPLVANLVEQAIQGNLDVRRAMAVLAQARALREAAAGAQHLQAGLGASTGTSRAAGVSTSSTRAGLDASWEVDLFGARGAATDAAAAQARAAAATLDATRQSIIAEVVLAYQQWQGLRIQHQLALATLAAQAQTRQITDWRVRAGLASALDSSLARLAVEQTQARLSTLVVGLAQAVHRLSVLTGQAPAALDRQLASSVDGRGFRRTGVAPEAMAKEAAPPPMLPRVLDLPTGLDAAAPADLLRRRPDLAAAEFRVEAAAATWAQRDAERLPNFSLSGTLTLAARSLSGLSGSNALASSLLAGMNWSWLDGGAARSRSQAQAAALEAARIDYQATLLAALQDVEDALVAIEAGQAQAASLANAHRAAQDALDYTRMRHQSGLVDLSMLLESQRTAASTGDAWVSARVSLAQQHVRLHKALGGAWQANPGDRDPP